MRTLPALALLLLAMPLGAVNNFYHPRPEASKIAITRDIEFRPGLKLDLYRPAGDEAVPLMIIANIGSSAYRGWGIYRGWGEAAAGNGLGAIVYDATPANAIADFDAVMDLLRKRASELHVDPSRVVVWSASANVQIGLPLAMDKARDYIRGAIVYYGDAPVEVIRTDVPVLLVRAGLDGTALNKRIDTLAARALSANAPWTIDNYGNGYHGFETLNDNDLTRMTIQRTLSFAKLVTRPDVIRAYTTGGEQAALGAAYANGDWPRAVAGYRAQVAANPADGEAHVRLGVSLLRAKQFAEAMTTLEKGWELGRRGPRDTAWPAAEAAAGAGNVERTVHWLNILLSTQFGPDLDGIRTDEAYARVRNEKAFVDLLDGVAQERRVTAMLLEGKREAIAEIAAAKNGRFAQERTLNGIGFRLLAQKKATEAAAVLKINTERHAQSANAWDSLAEAYEAGGEKTKAVAASKKAIALLEKDTSVSAELGELIRKESSARLERLR